MKTYNSPPRIIFAALCAFLCAFTTRAQVNVPIGTLQPGETVVITYDVTINSPLPPGTTQISSQGTVTGAGGLNVPTDDPDTAAANDATITALQNDAPVVTTADVVSYTEGGSAAAVSPNLTVTDADSPNLTSATVSIASGFFGGDQLAFVNQNGITGGYNNIAGILTLSGSSSVANYQAALRSILFSSSSDNPTDFGTKPARTIAFTVNDGMVDSAADTSTVNITAVNDPPVVTAGNTIGYLENGAPVQIAPVLTVSDDGPNLASALVFIDVGFVTGDTLGFVNQNGITGSYNSGTGVLDLSGSSTVANYQAALRSVTFSSSSENPTASGASPSRAVRFAALDDSPAQSTLATTTINVTAVNDAPVAGADTIQRAANDDTKVKVATLLLNDSDPDDGTLSITGVSSSTPGVTVTLAGEWVLYKHGTTTADSFTYTLSDGQGATSTGTINVAIQGPDTQAGPALNLIVDGTITFHALAGRTYIMQRASNVNGPWTDHGTATETTRGQYTYTATAGFYRAVYR